MTNVEYDDMVAAENHLKQPIKAPDSTVSSQEEPRETLGEYCKRLELPYTTGTAAPDLDVPRVVIPEGKYCIIRVDGRAFHTFTKPYKCKSQAFSADIINVIQHPFLYKVDVIVDVTSERYTYIVPVEPLVQ